MATTNYITIDGMLIGEITPAGEMRNYGTDSLGSVVTTSLNGVPENTYRYKPYGGLLAKTGTANDPSFLWNGGSGYRATTLPSASHYVRVRHFSMLTGQWTTTDPLWPQERPYGYVRGQATSTGDFSGLQQKAPPMPICVPTFSIAPSSFVSSVTPSKQTGMWDVLIYLPMNEMCICDCPAGASYCKGQAEIHQCFQVQECLGFRVSGSSGTDLGFPVYYGEVSHSATNKGNCPAQGTPFGCTGGTVLQAYDAPGISDGGKGRTCWNQPPGPRELGLSAMPQELNLLLTSWCTCGANTSGKVQTRVQVSCRSTGGNNPTISCEVLSGQGPMNWACGSQMNNLPPLDESCT